jgi:hypothetical protein
VLHQAGIVEREKVGNHARYSIADRSVFDLCEHVCGGIRRRIAELDGILAASSSGTAARERTRLGARSSADR